MGMLVNVSRTIFMSLRLAPSTARPIGMPAASTNWLRLTPCLARSVGFLPVFFPPERRLGHAAVHAHPGPVDPLHVVVGHQAYLPPLFKHPRLDPFLESVMRRGTWAKARGVQLFPLAPSAEYEENGLHTNAIPRPWPAATESMRVLVFGKKLLNGFPKIVRNTPVVRYGTSVHAKASLSTQLSVKQAQLHKGVIGFRGFSDRL